MEESILKEIGLFSKEEILYVIDQLLKTMAEHQCTLEEIREILTKSVDG